MLSRDTSGSQSPPGEEKARLELCGGGGLYRVRQPLISYVIKCGVDVVTSTHYETSTMRMMLRLPYGLLVFAYPGESYDRVVDYHPSGWNELVRVNSMFVFIWTL